MTIHSTFGKLAFSLALAGTFLFPGLDARAANDTTDTLNFVNYRDVRDLNPHLYAGEMYAQEMLFETLVDITADGYKPCLAESWDISPDGKVYTFHIRKGVTFTDGTPCDAFAIKANFDAILENRARHTWLEMMHLLEKVDAPDAHTFRIFMKAPYWPMLTELGVTRPFAIISPKAMKNGSTKNGVTAYVGTGPYKLTKVVTDEYAVFEANENYWGEQPAIKTITVKVIPDNQTRILALEKGEIDMIFGKNMIDADAISQYLDSDKFTNVEVTNGAVVNDGDRLLVLGVALPGLKERLDVEDKDGKAYIELTPKKEHKQISKIGVWINTKTNTVEKVSSFGKDGNDVVITIKSLKKPEKELDVNFFRFDKEAHPEVDIVDLR